MYWENWEELTNLKNYVEVLRTVMKRQSCNAPKVWAGLFESRLTLTLGLKVDRDAQFLLYKNVFMAPVLWSLRLVNVKTGGKQIKTENLTVKLKNWNQNSRYFWNSLIVLWTTGAAELLSSNRVFKAALNIGILVCRQKSLSVIKQWKSICFVFRWL